MTSHLLEQGVYLMLYGMGTVFVFLTVLVIATSAMSFLIQRYLPETAVTDRSVSDRSRTVSNINAHSMADNDTLAAIKLAIAEHRAR